MAPPRETCSSGDLQRVTKRYVYAFVGEGAAALDLAELLQAAGGVGAPGHARGASGRRALIAYTHRLPAW
jgi:hypothetical protein